MFAKDVIDINILPLKKNQTVADALEWCISYHSSYAYLVDENQLLGRFSEEMLFNYDDQTILATLVPFAELVSVLEDQHELKLLAKAKQFKCYILPIVDAKDKFLGLTSAESILANIFDDNMMNEQQSVFIVETTSNNYSFSDVAKIIESNNGQIIYSNLTTKENRIQLTLILYAENYAAIVNTFERFSYDVIYQSKENTYTDHFKDRAESFIKYLEV